MFFFKEDVHCILTMIYLMCRTQKRELGLAMMLLCVVTIFFLCNVLALVVNILEVGREGQLGITAWEQLGDRWE